MSHHEPTPLTGSTSHAEAEPNGSGRGLDSLGPLDRMNGPPPLSSRILSWWWDYVLIVGWLVLVFVVVGLPQLLGWLDLSPIWTEQYLADMAVTLLTVLPYFGYLTLTEWARPMPPGEREGQVPRSGPLTTGPLAGLAS